MKDEKKNTKKGTKAGGKNVKFEETYEGQMLLNSISAAFYKVRKENQYIGETRIMKNLTKKNSQVSQIKKTDQELERYSGKSMIKTEKNVQENILAQIYRKEGYIRTSPPKN
ncbi:MAG: hypothetical protein ACM3ME_10200 [Chloroflexota bacterium]|nr:hypothetical protein [Lentimicrobium sp.]